ncbi:MAG: molybdopterin oxidoreductase family protein [Armatimonadota bacterium]
MNNLPTICGLCSCGCAVYVEPKKLGLGIKGLCPSTTHPVSTGRLCIKGWNTTPSLIRSDRLQTPLIRNGDNLQPASWEEAVSTTANAIKKIAEEYGPSAVGVIGSAKTTNEECYSIAKFARAVLGTANVDGACRFYDASLIPALTETIGTPASQVEIGALQNARSVLIVGANVMEQLAHIGSRIQDAVENGCKVVAVDPRKTRLAPQATLFLHPRPGTDLTWIRALLKIVLDKKLYADHIPQMPGFEELRTSLEDVVMGVLPQVCEIEPEAVAQVASILAENRPCVVMFGLGILQQRDSTLLVKALADIALMLGGSIMPLRGQNNAQGSCDMGLLRDYLPGYEPVQNANARTKWETVWGCRIPSEPGLSSVDMVQGGVKALLVFGENVALSAPNTEQTISALEKLDFLAVSDLYLNETAQLADVVFPACSFLEKDGTFTNIDRRVQRVRKMVDPVGSSKTDLEIIAALASALGEEMTSDSKAVMNEIAANIPIYADVSYEKLDEDWGKPWPIPDSIPRLAPIPATDLPLEDNEYPFHLIASRINFHMQTGTMAARSNVLAREYPECNVEMNRADAEKLKLRPGSVVKISSKTGSIMRRLAVSESVPEGYVHMPHFFGGDSANMLASFDCDPASGVPFYKGIAVKVEAVQ